MGVVYLVRHGQASFGAADYDNLSELGVRQARLLGEALRGRLPRVDVVVTGGMRRHRQTAEACLAVMGGAAPGQAGLPPAEEEPGFAEFDHEEILERLEPRYARKEALAEDLLREGDPRRAFQALFARAVERWVAGAHDAEYRESWPAFRSRCTSALDRLVARLGRGGVALVFTSAGPIGALAARLLQVPDAHAAALNWSLANCGVTKVLASERGLTLSTLNAHGHLEGPEARTLITYR
jgi:broad specificity phosphatase PhoE